MVFYFYPELPITERGSIVCPLTGKGKISRVQLRRDTTLAIHSLFVPIGRYVYPTNILTHSAFVKGEQYNADGYTALSTGTINVKRYQRLWAVLAKSGHPAIETVVGSRNTKMAIPAGGIVMLTDYNASSIGDETVYWDNYQWKTKKILRVDGIKTVTYVDTVLKNLPPVVFDFEKLRFSVANRDAREHFTMTLTKFYYVTRGGRLGSTETNALFNTSKSDVEQLADTNPSYLLRNEADVSSISDNGLILHKSKLALTAYNNVTLFCIYHQKSYVLAQPFLKDLFTVTPMTSTEWGALAQKDKTVYDDMKAFRDKYRSVPWFKLFVANGKTIKWTSAQPISLSVTRYTISYDIYEIDLTNSAFFTGGTKVPYATAAMGL